ncbi:hypothetical protein CERSUDRAFT_111375 [Gelatoporia subvermispora B]|uniref:Uncharacterized protein n=1 Tax=Ceriporiopsis subvermispora (strain B) TaxID=914234 RepID=M2QUP5_CERS8|nr:hypothetical protein CERSUDRAFT_111375 [Gelatoporia subvermispora B]
MDLPSAREIELETLLRQRDTQIAELTDEISHLRQYLSTQPAPSTAEPISLPPALVSLLLPHINDRSSDATPSSGTLAAALTHRAKVLQEENDELYELLKSGETGRLKEDVRVLRRLVERLEGALKESHQVIASLSEELGKSHEEIVAQGRQAHTAKAHPHSQSPAPRNAYQMPPHIQTSTNGSSKPLPTGPRAHKKQRLSEPQVSPVTPNAPLAPPSKGYSQSSSGPLSDARDPRDARASASVDRKPPIVDEDQRTRPRSPEQMRDRGRDRGRERDARDKDRDRERDKGQGRDRLRDRDRGRDRDMRDRDRDRDRDRPARRNGGGPGGGGGGGGRRNRGGTNASQNATDRSLAQRMGL